MARHGDGNEFTILPVASGFFHLPTSLVEPSQPELNSNSYSPFTEK
jgi:hypothetical protein